MRRTRALWLSILFVTLLVAGSVALFATDVRPILGLDLEGGVSVVLSAPDGTPDTVMDQALENIRARIDAFGTAEPLLFVTGTNIEVQIPGLARGTVQERPRAQSCLFGSGESPFACFPDDADAQAELDAATVERIVQTACLIGGDDVDFSGEPVCFPTEQEADDAIAAIAVEEQEGEFCLVDTGLTEDPCFPDQARADEALAAIGTDVTQTFCVQGTADEPLRNDLGAACYATQEEADEQVAGLEVRSFDREFCVISSADRNLGCFLTRDLAEARLQETGQDRLLSVIGQTARLEFRRVEPGGVVSPGTPGYDELPVDCATQAEIEGDACSFEALQGEPVTLLGADGQTKYRLGPVDLTGDAIDRATAVLDTSSTVSTGWQISFDTTSEGAGPWGELTTELVGQQLAIVVDRQVISAPTVQDPITNGTGIISGSFTEARAKDLATQLNAGALPVELTTQQVVTVSPTLGKESLDAGILAGVAGLVLLALYLLFYYRVLALVAWLGMTIWAVLAFALIAVAGRSVGYNLTLAGVAGLVISLGVTADSYIVFFERFKDEVHAGRSPRTAVQPAFKKAFRTIVAADIVTAIAAIVLYLTAISSVRGFALTLGVSVLLDLFVVYFFKRPAVFLLARNERLVTMRGIGVISGVAADTQAAPVGAGGGR
jgi:preprotein translocase subunit SecD